MLVLLRDSVTSCSNGHDFYALEAGRIYDLGPLHAGRLIAAGRALYLPFLTDRNYSMPNPIYGLVRTTAPSLLPVTLAEFKAYLRVCHDDDDAMLTAHLETATALAEHYLKRSLLTQGWSLKLQVPDREYLSLPMGPVQELTEMTGGVAAELRPDDRLRIIQRPAGDVEITYTAGYGDTAAEVPGPIRHGIMAHGAALYDGVESKDLPAAVYALYQPYRALAL